MCSHDLPQREKRCKTNKLHQSNIPGMQTLKNIQTEIDAAYLYRKLSEKEEDETIAAIFREMSAIETSHAKGFLQKLNLPGEQAPKPSRRARILNFIGKVFGYDYVLGALMDTEKSLSNTVITSKKQTNMPVNGNETNHVKILRNILERAKVSGSTIARFESRHRSVGGNALRAAVLGGNDGLVSNFSLVMGVAGATAGGNEVLLAGIAGLLAGALSMALGEWISVKSSQELYENQMELEKEELETDPGMEMKELELIYKAKGIPAEQARQMAADIIKNPEHAHEVLVKEELGINPDELKGSAIEAALYSFFLFAIGAIIPVFPFMFTSGMRAIVISTLVSTVGLFVIGAAITLFTGRSIWRSGFRQVIFGLAAAAITFGIGKLIGVSITG
jgi:VIT1/CCC1 family predicted Fe2+/Mn2+ transporter